MKKLKSLFVCVLSLVIFTCVPVLSNADDRDIVVSLTLGNPIMQVNGVSAEIDAGRDTAPVAINGRTLVPIRAIIEAFGGSVEWHSVSNSVELTLDSDSIILQLDKHIAYYNQAVCHLDVAPTAINERTMLPIRFIAESFNLGVAWDNNTQTVYIIQNGFDEYEYSALKNMVPEYSGSAYVHLNNNYPFFKDYEIIPASFEYYSDLDYLGRCDVTMASVAEDIMPTEERGSISSVKPTGWINNSYDVVPGGYLYNRCHLIGYQLTGENANHRNLITGTRYLNIDGMLTFENMVDDYIERTGNHVMYRVTPVFDGSNLLAHGVLMEAYSVEDNGSGIAYCVYCYNVQPGIYLDYATGANNLAVSYALPQTPQSSQTYTETVNTTPASAEGIYRTPTGKRYHFDSACGGANSYGVTMEEALGAGLTPCKKCAQ